MYFVDWFFFFKQKTAYEMRISDWSSDVGSSDLGNGDRVVVTVFGQEELTGERVVDGGGNISMPLIGEVKAGGSTADELASTIAAELTPKYLNDPKVNIQVLGYRPFYIVGEVQKRSEEHTSELQSLMRTSYAVHCL